MSRFYAGQPVICINDNFDNVRLMYPRCAWPTRGSRYVVRDSITPQATTNGKIYVAVLLREITNPVVLYRDGVHREAGFWEGRFEPITENRVQALAAIATDIDPDEFQRILHEDEPDLHPTHEREKVS